MIIKIVDNQSNINYIELGNLLYWTWAAFLTSSLGSLSINHTIRESLLQQIAELVHSHHA